MKGKLYRTAVRPANVIWYGVLAVKNQHENQISIAEMKMLCWTSGKTRWDRIRNYTVRERIRVAPIVEKMVENILSFTSPAQSASEHSTISV